jgi:copper(I)-binding protein
VLRNGTDEDDGLLGVETPVADTAEIHTVSMDGDVMRMRPVPEVPVPAGGEAVLRPGGYHVMLIGVRGPLEEGDTVPLTLRLRSGRTLRLAAPVRRGPLQEQ